MGLPPESLHGLAPRPVKAVYDPYATQLDPVNVCVWECDCGRRLTLPSGWDLWRCVCGATWYRHGADAHFWMRRW